MSRQIHYQAEPGWEEGLIAQPEMVEGMHSRARSVARIVQGIAPVGETGDYKKLIYAHRDAVYAHDFAWHWVEFGSVNNHPKAPLRRGTIAAGLRFVPHSKPT